MLKKWLSNVKNESFIFGINVGLYDILRLCKLKSMPVGDSYEEDENMYVSISQIEDIINSIKKEYTKPEPTRRKHRYRSPAEGFMMIPDDTFK